MTKKIGVKFFVSTLAFIIGIAVGFSTMSTLADNKINRSQDKAPIYPVNENGQTYGSAADAISIETEPDLIAAIGIDGTKGYVLAKDLRANMPKTPEEAIAQMNARKTAEANGTYEGRLIPLYDVDGKTVIGQYRSGVGVYPKDIGAAQYTEIFEESNKEIE